MELFTALLTGFFAWLWLFHFQRGRRTRAREAAGLLLMEVKVAPRVLRTLRWTKFWLVVIVLINPGAKIAMLYYMHASHPSTFPNILRLLPYSFSNYLAAAGYLAICLLIFLPTTPSRIAFEIRELGILHVAGAVRFLPWKGIEQCRWFRAKTRLGRWFGWGQPRAYKRSCFTAVEERIADGQKAAVTAELSRFAPVYDCGGALLAEPSEADVAARAVLPSAEPSRFLLQFDLQSLMLLVVVVSCGASCYGIHLRRLQPQWDAFAHFQSFQPSITDWSGMPVGLDFSKCANKPTNSDLAHLEPLEELRSLDLSGAPITDAGLVHLTKLKRLDYITLTDTAVTAQGAAELSRALPEADIFFGRTGGGRRFFGPSHRPGAKAGTGGK
jgi:hypothetical protein